MRPFHLATHHSEVVLAEGRVACQAREGNYIKIPMLSLSMLMGMHVLVSSPNGLGRLE